MKRNAIIEGETVDLDSGEFYDCTFKGCRMRYAGGVPPVLSGCSFDDCSWGFSGEAANTLAFLAGARKGGLEPFVESVFESVRVGNFIAPSQQSETVTSPKKKLHPLMSRVPRLWKIPKVR